MKQALIYSFKVWLTNIMLAPLLAYVILILGIEIILGNYQGSTGVIMGGGVSFFGIALFHSVPFGILLVVVTYYINKQAGNTNHKKKILSILCILYPFLLGIILYVAHDKHQQLDVFVWVSILSEGLSSLIITIAGVWFYKLNPVNQAITNTD
jgi:hypothetical protein